MSTVKLKKDPRASKDVPRINKNKDPRASKDVRGSRRTAATYSPNWYVSTIGAGELNFSVRNGKRWNLTAETTAIYYLRDYSVVDTLSHERVRAISTGRL